MIGDTPPVRSELTFADKLLSHRLKGFDRHESTIIGLVNALGSGAKHVEFDIRVTKDRQLLTHHDPFFFDKKGKFWRLRDLTVEEIQAKKSPVASPTLDAMLDAFQKNSDGASLVHIDVKSAGVEQQVVDSILKYGVVDQVVIVSWLPSVLENINRIDGRLQLCYSHVPFARFPWLYTLSKVVLNRTFLNSVSLLGLIINSNSAHTINSLRLFFDNEGVPAPLKKEDMVGYNHGHLIAGMVDADMQRLLGDTGGLVCIPKVCATPALISSYHDREIKVAVFSIKDEADLVRTNGRILPDIFYVDDAKLFRSGQ